MVVYKITYSVFGKKRYFYNGNMEIKKIVGIKIFAGLLCCKIGGYISIISVCVSVFTLVAISVDR